MHSAKNAEKITFRLFFFWINCEEFVLSCNIRESVPCLNSCALCAGFQKLECALMEIEFSFSAFNKVCSNIISIKSPEI
jgi:hypothetical protein